MAKTSTEQYRTNAKSRAKHVRDNSSGWKYAHSKKYKRDHAKARESLKIR